MVEKALFYLSRSLSHISFWVIATAVKQEKHFQLVSHIGLFYIG